MSRSFCSLLTLAVVLSSQADEPTFTVRTTTGEVHQTSAIAYAAPEKLVTLPPAAGETNKDPRKIPLDKIMSIDCPEVAEATTPVQLARKIYPGEWRLPADIGKADSIATGSVTRFEVVEVKHEDKPTTALFAHQLLIPITGDWTFRAIAPDLLGLAIGDKREAVITPDTPEATAVVKLEAGQHLVSITVPSNKKRIYQIEVSGPGLSGDLADLLLRPRNNNVVELFDGSRLTGAVSTIDDGHLTLEGGIGKIRIPTTTIRTFYPDLPALSQRLASVPPSANLVLVANKDRLVELDATVSGLTAEHLIVNHGGQERKIALGRLAGFRLAAAATKAAPTAIRLSNGNRLHGTLAKFGAESIELTTPWHNGPISIASAKVSKLLMRPPGCIFLSDLDPVEVKEHAWFGYPVAWRRNRGFAADNPSIAGNTFGHVLALHSFSNLRYAAADADARLLATVGIEEPAPSLAAATVTVRVGDSVAATIASLSPATSPWQIDVPVPAGARVELEVDFGPNEDVGDRVIFGNPRLLLNHLQGRKP